MTQLQRMHVKTIYKAGIFLSSFFTEQNVWTWELERKEMLMSPQLWHQVRSTEQVKEHRGLVAEFPKVTGSTTGAVINNRTYHFRNNFFLKFFSFQKTSTQERRTFEKQLSGRVVRFCGPKRKPPLPSRPLSVGLMQMKEVWETFMGDEKKWKP